MMSTFNKIFIGVFCGIVSGFIIGQCINYYTQSQKTEQIVTNEKDSEPVYLDGYGVTNDYVCVSTDE